MIELVVMGASLGGLEAVGLVLAALPHDFGAIVAVVMHRRADAESRLMEMLGSRSRLPVREPDDKTPLEAGIVYLAPPDYHLLVEPGHVALSVDEPECYSRPSINLLFESAADAYGRRTVAVLLTGSSEDGAHGLEQVQRAGGVTVVQDPASAESPVAPRAALERIDADYVLRLEAIAPLLVQLRSAKDVRHTNTSR